MEEYKLFDAEYRLMELVWNLEPVNSTALARRDSGPPDSSGTAPPGFRWTPPGR